MKIKLLSQQVIRQALSMRRAIGLMEEAFAALTLGKIEAPLRTNLTSANGTVLYKPAILDVSNMFGVKVVSIFPNNAPRNLPVTTGLMLINDGETG
ncbi:MAG: ornithine cyclodeaminase family protein, partial [Planctomycetota bacterium]